MIWSKVNALSSGQHFLHYKSMGKVFVAQRRVTPKWIVRPGPILNLVKILWLSLLPASLMKSRSKWSRNPSDNIFQIIVYGSFRLLWKQMFWSNLPLNLMQISPTTVILHIKFDQDQPTCLRDIQVWNWTRSKMRILALKSKNIAIWPVWDHMPVLIICKSESESESELLLVTRSNDNHSPGPVMREVSP